VKAGLSSADGAKKAERIAPIADDCEAGRRFRSDVSIRESQMDGSFHRLSVHENIFQHIHSNYSLSD
jgi:hypothetical protein